jgi:hypothetical protein
VHNEREQRVLRGLSVQVVCVCVFGHARWGQSMEI